MTVSELQSILESIKYDCAVCIDAGGYVDIKDVSLRRTNNEVVVVLTPGGLENTK